MHHLHIPVLGVDRYLEYMKHRKCYYSFAAEFFMAIEDFPQSRDNKRRHRGRVANQSVQIS